MTPDQMLLLLDSFFATLRDVVSPTKSAATRLKSAPPELAIVADILDDLDRPNEARNLRDGFGTLVRLPATKKSPARVVVLLVRVAREIYRSRQSNYFITRERWRVNGVVVGNFGTMSANLARRIRHVYAIELTPAEVRLLGKKVFSTLA